MTFEELMDIVKLYSINPELTCTCDDLHMCQQCFEDAKNDHDLSAYESRGYEGI